VTCAAIIPDTLPRSFPTNLQILLSQPLSEVGSDTLFLSFSHEFDHARVPQGFRTMSVNMHIRPERFEAVGEGAAYIAWKERVTLEVLEAIRRSVPELADLRTEYCEVATPRTYRRYTGRSQGLVGGIPLSRAIFPWKYPKSVTPFRGLSAIGDTFFPGQGLPGVVLGALALRRRMARMERTR
jgi:phytoene dehydrogenase-like protein